MRALLLVGAVIGTIALYQSNASMRNGPSGDGFCATHQCIPNFPNGKGFIVQCLDGMWSHSGGRPGACSGHGGER